MSESETFKYFFDNGKKKNLEYFFLSQLCYFMWKKNNNKWRMVDITGWTAATGSRPDIM